jgi:nitroimidazol reductase NimA-like FMN-containing flavoprotein (pyridoxamine 5'-phosphate oxidase superfamily)
MSQLDAELTQLKRRKDRGVHDKETIFRIIDEAFLAHVAVNIQDQPHIIPLLHKRIENFLYLHGSATNRILTHLADGERASINITIADGLVLGATIPDHSMNYRSVVIYGEGSPVEGEDEKMRVMERVFSALVPDRWQFLPPLDREYLNRQTQIVRVPLDRSVAKINDSKPTAHKNELDVWTGIIPLRYAWGPPESVPTHDRVSSADVSLPIIRF